MLPKNELFVDTGIDTGWAFFSGTRFPFTGSITCSVRMRKTLENYIRYSAANFTELLSRLYNVSKVSIEHPEFWKGPGKGKDAIQTGSLLHLAANAYCYATVCATNNIPFKLYTAKQWKGNLSKVATEYRIKLINGKSYKNDHIADAVGMGLSRDKNLWLLRNKK